MIRSDKKYMTRNKRLVRSIEKSGSDEWPWKVQVNDYEYHVDINGKYGGERVTSMHDLIELPDSFGEFVVGETYITRSGMNYTVERILSNPLTEEDKAWYREAFDGATPPYEPGNYPMYGQLHAADGNKHWVSLTLGGCFNSSGAKHSSDIMTVTEFELLGLRAEMEEKARLAFAKSHRDLVWRPVTELPKEETPVYITVLINNGRDVLPAWFRPNRNTRSIPVQDNLHDTNRSIHTYWGFYLSWHDQRPIDMDRVCGWTTRPTVSADIDHQPACSMEVTF